jgi:hypothetical protein
MKMGDGMRLSPRVFIGKVANREGRTGVIHEARWSDNHQDWEFYVWASRDLDIAPGRWEMWLLGECHMA